MHTENKTDWHHLPHRAFQGHTQTKHTHCVLATDWLCKERWRQACLKEERELSVATSCLHGCRNPYPKSIHTHTDAEVANHHATPHAKASSARLGIHTYMHRGQTYHEYSGPTPRSSVFYTTRILNKQERKQHHCSNCLHACIAGMAWNC